MFERDGKPYRVDYAAMARAFGARGVMIESADELGPALREALASNLPTVIQVPMENAPTPTPGHWNINDIYRKGRMSQAVTLSRAACDATASLAWSVWGVAATFYLAAFYLRVVARRDDHGADARLRHRRQPARKLLRVVLLRVHR